jgi:hypothetical protein
MNKTLKVLKTFRVFYVNIMPKVKLTPSGRLILPADFLQRRHIVPPVEYWLDEREGDLILQPCLPDIQKVYK